MIATILPGSPNFHAVLYNERKVAKGTARLIEIKNFGILEDIDSFGKPAPEELRSYLQTYSERNGRIHQTQFHLAISCKGKEMTEDELLDFAHAYLKEMGYGQEGQPLLVYAHAIRKTITFTSSHQESHLTEPRLTTVRSGYALKGQSTGFSARTHGRKQRRIWKKPRVTATPRWHSSRLSFPPSGMRAMSRTTHYI